jgi:hypothetical protein
MLMTRPVIEGLATKFNPPIIMESAQQDNKSQVLEVTKKVTELMIKKDTASLNKILDERFTLTHITGYVQSKEDWYAEIASERMKYYSYKEIKTSVEIKGDRATFIGQNILDARIWGTRNKWNLQQIMQLEKRGNRWIILKSVATTF